MLVNPMISRITAHYVKQRLLTNDKYNVEITWKGKANLKDFDKWLKEAVPTVKFNIIHHKAGETSLDDFED